MLVFAGSVDKLIAAKLGYARSGQSMVQKDVADQMILDHFQAGSTAAETAEIIARVLMTLE